MSRIVPFSAVLFSSLLLVACEGGDGADGADGTNGSAGLNSLTTLSVEPVGVICTHGGQRIDTGLDDDRDGVLDSTEIDNTSYVCSTSITTVYSTEYRGDLCLHGATLLKSGPDLDNDGVLDAGEVLSTATICQNNAGPSFWLRAVSDDVWHAPTYDASARRFNVDMYDSALSNEFFFVSDDPNNDSVTITPAAAPAGSSISFENFLPSDLYPEADDPARTAEAGMHVLLGSSRLSVGVHDLPIHVTDGEAGTDYTVRLNVLASGAQFTPYLAQEGVDTFAGGRVTLNTPASGTFRLYSETPNLEVCLDGAPCAPANVTYESCPPGFPPGNPACTTYVFPDTFLLPTGTTGFDLRMPITDDTTWGNHQQQPISLLMDDGHDGHFVVSNFTGRFSVLENDAAPTVSFLDAVYSGVSGGGLIDVLIQSSLVHVFIPVIIDSAAVEGVDYQHSGNFVWIGDTGTGTLQINTYLDESMTVDYVINLAFDESAGMVLGAQPTATVTVTPPPPLALAFQAASSSVSRYGTLGGAEACVTVALNRVSYIASVDFTVSLSGGTAVEGDDYWSMSGVGPLITIEPGATEHSVCFQGVASEQVADRTLEFTISNISGAAAGALLTHTVTLDGGAFPTVGFAEITRDAMTDIGVNSDCLTVQYTGDVPNNGLVEYVLHVVPSDPQLASMLMDAGFVDTGSDWQYYDYFSAGAVARDFCFNRPVIPTAAVGAHTFNVQLTLSGPAHLDDAMDQAQLLYTQNYGVRSLRVQPDMLYGIYSTDSLALPVVADNGAVGVFGIVDGCAVEPASNCTNPYDMLLQYIGADGARRWQYVYSEDYHDRVTASLGDDVGNLYFIIEDRNDFNVPQGYTVTSLDENGSLRWAFPGTASVRMLAAHNGVLLLDNGAGGLSVIGSDGGTAWSKTAADFGISGCPEPVRYEATPATSGWYVAAIPDLVSACSIQDHDLDSVTHDVVIAHIANDGSMTWLRDDTDGTALERGYLTLRTDGANNLYLADRFEVVKLSSAGAAAWTTATPAPATLPWSERVEFDVTPAGASAGIWSLNNYGDFAGIPPLAFADVGVWALDASGALVTTALVGSGTDDYAYDVLARDDGEPLALIFFGSPYMAGLFRVSAPDQAEQVQVDMSSQARTHRVLDGDILVTDLTTGYLARRAPTLELR